MTLEPDKPSTARMYDYLLGGYHNFAIDRRAAEQIVALYPDAALAAQTNRAFLRRAVTFLLEQGIDQFLDIGSGIPTAGNVHEIVHRIRPDARVIYVDIDPVAVTYSQTILQGSQNVAAIDGDVREPDELLAHAEVRSMIDFQRPVAILMVALLHFVPADAEAQRVVQALAAAVPVGSYLVISHVTNEYLSQEVIAESEAVYARSTTPSKLRSRAQIAALFEGLEFVEPGLVLVPLWRPNEADDLFLDTPEQSMFFAGVGRKP
jgi:SAM-dependent methyltransferase